MGATTSAAPARPTLAQGGGERSLRRFVPGLALAGVGLAPFLIAGLAWQSHGGELDGAGLIGGCPMLEITGIPCIGCGGARAFFHFAHGDGAFLDYNWLWPLIALAAIAYGAVLLVRAARGGELFGAAMRALRFRYATQPVRMAAITLAVLLLPWLVALSNLDSIRSA
jgi:hypothetical protein